MDSHAPGNCATGLFTRAATLFGLAEQVSSRIRYALVEPVRALVDAALATVRTRLDPADVAEVFATGQQISLEAAFTTILAPTQVTSSLVTLEPYS